MLIDVAELGVPIRMLGPLDRLHIRLERVPISCRQRATVTCETACLGASIPPPASRVDLLSSAAHSSDRRPSSPPGSDPTRVRGRAPPPPLAFGPRPAGGSDLSRPRPPRPFPGGQRYPSEIVGRDIPVSRARRLTPRVLLPALAVQRNTRLASHSRSEHAKHCRSVVGLSTRGHPV